MHSDDTLGRACLARDLGDRQRGRVRRDDGVGPEHLLEIRDDAALGRDLLEDGLDHQIGVPEPGEIRSAADPSDDARGLAALEHTLLRGVRGELADRGKALRHRRRITVARPHAQTEGRRRLRDARAHEAQTDDTDVRDRPRRAQPLERGLPLAEREHHERGEVAPRVACGELAERARLRVETRADSLREARGDRVERSDRRGIATPGLRERARAGLAEGERARGREPGGGALDGGHTISRPALAIAQRVIGSRARQDGGMNDFVDDAGAERALR